MCPFGSCTLCLVSSNPIIAGIDEAGRGPLAGPVVAVACVLPHPLFRRRGPRVRWSPHRRKSPRDCFIADSKSLTSSERERAFAWITAHCFYGVGIVAHDAIETLGIRPATHQAMMRALANLRQRIEPTLLRIDGCDRFPFDLPHRYIIRGDASDPAIAAASIIAKVTRDHIMIRSGKLFPLYGFEAHKGYGSREHIAMIRRFGPCVIHRRTFLTRILQSPSLRGRNHNTMPNASSGSV